MATLDPRLEHPDKIAAALDALGAFMDATAVRGSTLYQQEAIKRFHDAWPRPPEPETPEAEPSADGESPTT